MYPAYREVAEMQGEERAEQSFHWALEAEKVHSNPKDSAFTQTAGGSLEHAGMFQEAKQEVEGGADLDLGTVQICEVCGYTLEGEAPDRCPICNAPREKFRAFE